MSEDSLLFDPYFPAPFDLRFALGAFSAWLPFDDTFYCVAEDCDRGTLIFTAYPWADVEIEDEGAWQENVEKKLSERGRGGYEIFPGVSNRYYICAESYLKEIHYWELWYIYRHLQLLGVEDIRPLRFVYKGNLLARDADGTPFPTTDPSNWFGLPDWWEGDPNRPYELYVWGERPEGENGHRHRDDANGYKRWRAFAERR